MTWNRINCFCRLSQVSRVTSLWIDRCIRPGSGDEAGDDGRCMVDIVYFGDQLNSSSEMHSSAFQVCLGLIDSTTSRLCYPERHP